MIKKSLIKNSKLKIVDISSFGENKKWGQKQANGEPMTGTWGGERRNNPKY